MAVSYFINKFVSMLNTNDIVAAKYLIERRKMTNIKIDGVGFNVDDDGSITINNNHTIEDLKEKIINYLYQKDVEEYTLHDIEMLRILLIEK